MKWYFVLNSAAHETYKEAARVAVESCLKNTSLVPHLIYDGDMDEIVHWMLSKGVQVHHRSVTFSPILEQRAGLNGLNPQVARGAYLRLMIPLVETEQDFVLYTDCDVIFQRDPIDLLKALRPSYIAACTEAIRNDLSFFNSGVMLINIRELKAAMEGLFKFIDRHLPYWPGFSPNDQGCLNYFFRGLWDPMPENLNWKPYWGINESAYIIHFHGSRPSEIVSRLSGYSVDKYDKSETRKAVFSDKYAREALAKYVLDYYHNVGLHGVGLTHIDSAIADGASISLSLQLGTDLSNIRLVEMVVLSDGLRSGTVLFSLGEGLEGGKHHKSEIQFEREARADQNHSLFSEHIPYLHCKLTGNLTSEGLELTSRDALSGNKRSATLFSQQHTISYRSQEYLLRPWTLRGLNWSFSRSSIEPFELDFHDVVQQLKGRSGLIQGNVVQCVSESSDAHPFNNYIDEDDYPYLFLRVDKIHPFRRVFSILTQVAAYEDYFGIRCVRTYAVGLSLNELHLLRSFEIHCHHTPADSTPPAGHAWIAFEGAGLHLTTASNLVDGFVRRRQTLHISSQNGLFLYLNDVRQQSQCACDLVKKLGGKVMMCADEITENGVESIRTAEIIIIDAARLAPLLIFASPAATVIHIGDATSTPKKLVQRFCSVRNLLYCSIDIPDSILEDVSSSGTLKALLMQIMETALAAGASTWRSN